MSADAEGRRLLAALGRLEAIVHWPEERLYAHVPGVSAWSVAQHVDHLLLTTDAMMGAIETVMAGDEERVAPRPRLTWPARIVLWTGWIPRGKADAPERYVPEAQPRQAGLRTRLGPLRERAHRVLADPRRIADARGALAHPGGLGHMSAAQWLRFARVHAEHHLRIVDDIDRHLLQAARVTEPVVPAS